MKIDLEKLPVRQGSGYPDPWRQKSANRMKRRLGDAVGLTDFGVNLTRLPPGEWSAARHWRCSGRPAGTVFIPAKSGT